MTPSVVTTTQSPPCLSIRNTRPARGSCHPARPAANHGECQPTQCRIVHPRRYNLGAKASRRPAWLSRSRGEAPLCQKRRWFRRRGRKRRGRIYGGGNGPFLSLIEPRRAVRRRRRGTAAFFSSLSSLVAKSANCEADAAARAALFSSLSSRSSRRQAGRRAQPARRSFAPAYPASPRYGKPEEEASSMRSLNLSKRAP